jgi:hypothetical protein
MATLTGTDSRLVAMMELVARMSLRLSVLAREGRGGGDDMPLGFEDRVLRAAEVRVEPGDVVAANGSWSTRVGGGVDDGKLCLRARGGCFWRELRTRGGVAEPEPTEPSTGVFDLKEADWVGGGGACLVGSQGSR